MAWSAASRPKTAAKWLAEYGTLENVIANADAIKGKIGENLRAALPRLPLNLLDALRSLESSDLGDMLGPVVPSYLGLKQMEWQEFSRQLTAWERDTTLDC